MEEKGIQYYITAEGIKNVNGLRKAIIKLDRACLRAEKSIEKVKQRYIEVLNLKGIEIEIKVKEPKGGESDVKGNK